ncbi:unnamed protein product [Kuraishia capsulata CBS 1993]|uniref:Septum formation protein Maf n=1 Tax=Kuraishia capsulata CBS 1993 TaxID=1382522 RepID=W6MQN4_9ASCO|nr:uncharacterized protein KUCA_T00005031001 [Kuraishia capsulata CBS 1993]CDK29044.1 unnamed protein product [Kuraishia capsulata CBS 1993]
MSVKPFNHPVFAALEKKRFILASTSPRRAEILQSLGIKDIEIIASSFEENLDKSIRTPEEVSEELNILARRFPKKNQSLIALLICEVRLRHRPWQGIGSMESAKTAGYNSRPGFVGCRHHCRE